MIILLKDTPAYRDRILEIVLDGVMIDSGILSDLRPSKLVELLCDGRKYLHETPETLSILDSSACEFLVDSLIDFCMVILVAPLHRSIQLDTDVSFSEVHFVLLRVIFSLPSDFQRRMISKALDITMKLMKRQVQEEKKSDLNKLEVKRKKADNLILNICGFEPQKC